MEDDGTRQSLLKLGASQLKDICCCVPYLSIKLPAASCLLLLVRYWRRLYLGEGISASNLTRFAF
jgi:hypothetical protein